MYSSRKSAQEEATARFYLNEVIGKGFYPSAGISFADGADSGGKLNLWADSVRGTSPPLMGVVEHKIKERTLGALQSRELVKKDKLDIISESLAKRLARLT